MNQPQPEQPSLLQKVLISPDEPRLRAGWRLLLQSLLLVLCLVLLGMTANLGLRLLVDIAYAGLLLLGIVVSSLAITISVYLARRFLDHRSFTSLGLKMNNQAVADLMVGVGFSGLVMGLIFLVLWAVDWVQVESFAWEVENWGEITGSILVMLVLFSLVSWQEELLSRGYWLQNLSAGLSLSLGVLISSILFSFTHWFNPNLGWQALVGLFLTGLFLAFAYLRTGQLWLPIGLHLGWNFFEGTLFGFPVSGQYQYQLVRQTTTGPDLITGGAFGPEAGLILLPALILGAALVYWYTQNRTPGQNKQSGKT